MGQQQSDVAAVCIKKTKKFLTEDTVLTVTQFNSIGGKISKNSLQWPFYPVQHVGRGFPSPSTRKLFLHINDASVFDENQNSQTALAGVIVLNVTIPAITSHFNLTDGEYLQGALDDNHAICTNSVNVFVRNVTNGRIIFKIDCDPSDPSYRNISVLNEDEFIITTIGKAELWSVSKAQCMSTFTDDRIGKHVQTFLLNNGGFLVCSCSTAISFKFDLSLGLVNPTVINLPPVAQVYSGTYFNVRDLVISWVVDTGVKNTTIHAMNVNTSEYRNFVLPLANPFQVIDLNDRICIILDLVSILIDYNTFTIIESIDSPEGLPFYNACKLDDTNIAVTCRGLYPDESLHLYVITVKQHMQLMKATENIICQPWMLFNMIPTKCWRKRYIRILRDKYTDVIFKTK
jgi:hypothetical protein